MLLRRAAAVFDEAARTQHEHLFPPGMLLIKPHAAHGLSMNTFFRQVVCMCVCIFDCIYMYVYVCVYGLMSVRMYVCMHVCMICVCIRMYKYILQQTQHQHLRPRG
jgi:hypothetical protein